MGLVNYPKFQILIHPESKKVQGLRIGDIVRRQYFDGTNIIYSLMCVVDYGVERTLNQSTGLFEDRQYFVGALLEGDAPDPENKSEILDFARITSLCDVNRLGALYLTASDDQSPFMDVIDGIGRNKSLSWPENLAAEAFEDAKSQYIVKHNGNLHLQYTPWADQQNRILTITRQAAKSLDFEGLQQDFYEYVANPNQVLISYKIRASKDISANATLGYVNGVNTDGTWTEQITTDWEYKFRVVTVDFSGRHLRTFKLALDNLDVNEEVQISDFNIILLSSVANFGEASVSRFGKLDGVADSVFGRLSGYGAYIQKLYASKSAHISGTLTAGDENGFGSTFYAGKIHRNSFHNSIYVNFISDITIDWYLNEHLERIDNFSIVNPTGIGHVYRSNGTISMIAQDSEWLQAHADKRYCFSFWMYAKTPCPQIGIKQNGKAVGTIQITSEQTHKWRRVHVYFDLLTPENQSEPLVLEIVPTFGESIYNVVGLESNPDEAVYYFTAPQLEAGETVTQYQPTDSELNYTDSYGAWLAEGGIGGTIQNPLIKLNKDGSGAIESRGSGFRLNTDGSGHLAKQNIRWGKDGKVSFGHNVTLNWDNFGDDVRDEIVNRYVRISGDDTFTVIGQENAIVGNIYSPASILLTLEETGFTSTSSQRQWYIKTSTGFQPIPDANGLTFNIDPDSSLWNGESYITLKCVLTLDPSHVYADTFTVKKQFVQGYNVIVTSSQGTTFRNGVCQTILTAHVYYQGQLVDLDYARSHFVYTWLRYKANDMSAPIPFEDYDLQEDTPETIVLNYNLDSSDVFVCQISTEDMFDYTFPVIF